MQVTASAPASATASATSTMRSVFGLSLAHRGRPQAAVAAITAADSSASWAKIASRLQVRAGQVDLDGDDLRRCGGEQLGGPGVVVDRAPPDRGDDGGAGAQQIGQHVVEPVRHAGSLQPDGVEHPLRCRVQAGRRVAGPLVGGERLDDERAERREVEVRGQLGAVTGRPGRRHHGVGQRHRPDRRHGRPPALPVPVVCVSTNIRRPTSSLTRIRGRPAPSSV